MKWKIPSQTLLWSTLGMIVLTSCFDLFLTKQRRAFRDIQSMVPLARLDLQETLIQKKWTLEKTGEKKVGNFRKISYTITSQEPLLLEEIETLIHHPEVFSTLVSIGSRFCFYENISLDRSTSTTPNHSYFKAAWYCYSAGGA